MGQASFLVRCASRRWLMLGALVGLTVPGMSCSPEARIAETVAECSFTPSPPEVGRTSLRCVVTEEGDVPVEVDVLSAEANMTHPGMQPVQADFREISPGTYETSFDFTMAGDWYVVVSGYLPDGRRVEHLLEVPAVQGSR